MSEQDPRRPIFDVLSGIRKKAIRRFGTRAVHAAEDGATFGFLLGIIPTFPTGAMVLLAAFGIESRNPKRLIQLADKIGRTDDIQDQPLYFVVFLALFALIGAATGTGLQTLYSTSGLSQSVTDILMGM